MKRTLVLLLVVVAIAYAWYESKDPEDRSLDAAAQREAPGKFIQLADGFTHYEVAGPDSGDVVVLAAGFSVPYYIWDPLFKTLADSGFRVVRYDYYGRGWSDRPNVEYTPDLYVRQLAGLLASLDVKGLVHVVGLSYGGSVITSFTNRYPARVASITYIDATLPEPYNPTERVRSWLRWQRFMVFEGGSDKLATGQLDDFLHPEKHPHWVDRYRVTQQFHGTREAVRRSHLGIATGRSHRPLLAGIAQRKTPVLIVWGAQDKVVEFPEIDSLRLALPQATFVTVDSAGHLPHIEQADAVAAHLLRHLRAASSETAARASPSPASVPSPVP